MRHLYDHVVAAFAACGHQQAQAFAGQALGQAALGQAHVRQPDAAPCVLKPFLGPRHAHQARQQRRQQRLLLGGEQRWAAVGGAARIDALGVLGERAFDAVHGRIGRQGQNAVQGLRLPELAQRKLEEGQASRRTFDGGHDPFHQPRREAATGVARRLLDRRAQRVARQRQHVVLTGVDSLGKMRRIQDLAEKVGAQGHDDLCPGQAGNLQKLFEKRLALPFVLAKGEALLELIHHQQQSAPIAPAAAQRLVAPRRQVMFAGVGSQLIDLSIVIPRTEAGLQAKDHFVHQRQERLVARSQQPDHRCVVRLPQLGQQAGQHQRRFARPRRADHRHKGQFGHPVEQVCHVPFAAKIEGGVLLLKRLQPSIGHDVGQRCDPVQARQQRVDRILSVRAHIAAHRLQQQRQPAARGWRPLVCQNAPQQLARKGGRVTGHVDAPRQPRQLHKRRVHIPAALALGAHERPKQLEKLVEGFLGERCDRFVHVMRW